MNIPRITKEMILKQNERDKEKLQDLMRETRHWTGRSCQAGSPIGNSVCEAYELVKSLYELGGISEVEYNNYMEKICSVKFDPYRNPRHYIDGKETIDPDKYYNLPFSKTMNLVS